MTRPRELFELVAEILHDLNSRVYLLESDREGRGDDRECNRLLDKLNGLLESQPQPSGREDSQ